VISNLVEANGVRAAHVRLQTLVDVCNDKSYSLLIQIKLLMTLRHHLTTWKMHHFQG
jgi:hypothetical protein